MLRIMMLLLALLAIVAVLWATWQVNRKLFTPALLLVLVALGFFAAGVWQSSEQSRVPLDPGDIEISVDDARGMEEGVRLRGWIHNHSRRPISHLEGQAILLNCDDEQPDADCRRIDTAGFTLRRHVPSGSSYTWSAIIRMPAARLREGDSWQIELTEVTGFHNDQGNRRAE